MLYQRRKVERKSKVQVHATVFSAPSKNGFRFGSSGVRCSHCITRLLPHTFDALHNKHTKATNRQKCYCRNLAICSLKWKMQQYGKQENHAVISPTLDQLQLERTAKFRLLERIKTLGNFYSSTHQMIHVASLPKPTNDENRISDFNTAEYTKPESMRYVILRI